MANLTRLGHATKAPGQSELDSTYRDFIDGGLTFTGPSGSALMS